MAIRQIEIQRFSVTSSKSFEEVLAAVDAAVGHPDLNELRRTLGSTTTYAAMENPLARSLDRLASWSSFVFDHGEILRKKPAKGTSRIVRLVVATLSMKQMVEHVPDAGSYAPATFLIDEPWDVVPLTYDTMEQRSRSLQKPYGFERREESR
jgi:hypothetical protein